MGKPKQPPWKDTKKSMTEATQTPDTSATPATETPSALAAAAATVPVVLDTTRRVDLPGGGILVVNETTGKMHVETADGERIEVGELPPPPSPPPPPKPEPVVGKLIVGDDGVQRFVPDDGSEPLDLTRAIEAREDEAKKPAYQKKIEEIEKQMLDAREAVEAAKTPEEKLAAANQALQQMYGTALQYYNLALSNELAMRAQARLIPLTQVAQALP